jgi:hypothetical protein
MQEADIFLPKEALPSKQQQMIVIGIFLIYTQGSFHVDSGNYNDPSHPLEYNIEYAQPLFPQLPLAFQQRKNYGNP